jgi:HEAT repeat protein
MKIKMEKIKFKSKKNNIIWIILLLSIFMLSAETEAKFMFFGKEQSEHEKLVNDKVKKLTNKNSNIKINAAKELIKLEGKKAAHHLIGQLKKEKDPVSRADLAEVLGGLGSKESAADLIEIIKQEKDNNAKQVEVLALGQTGNNSAVTPLREIFLDSSDDINVRLQAGNGLSYQRGDEVFNIFKAALLDENPRIRKQALVGLHNMDYSLKEKIKLFKEAEKDEAASVTDFAEELLSIYGQK